MRTYLKQGKYSYSPQDLLGEGSFGKVYRGYNHTEQHWMALKQIELAKLQKYGDELKTIILSEINVMRKFRQNMKTQYCQYIVAHQDCFRTESYIYIAMELCNGGTLQQYLKNRKLTQYQAVQILFCLCEGMSYMHKLGITHRDIKPENIFLSEGQINGQPKRICKIGDFGFADRKQDYDLAMGTLPYMAPEMFKKQKYTNKVDIWSLGVIAYELIFRSLYFMGKDKWDIQKNIKEMPFALTEPQRNIISPQYYQFMAQCLNKNPQQRISYTQILSCPVFQQLKKQQKVDIFTKIYGLLEECGKMRQMAEQFCVFGEQTKRMTEFIQIYLLKQAYAMINRIAYTVMNKQDYIGVPEEEFKWLLDPSRESQYNVLNDKSQKQCLFITNLFNEKYKEFSKYISKFPEEDQALINQAVDEHPYSYVNEEVFEKQISKWAVSLSQYKKLGKLRQECQRMAIIRKQND